MPYTGNPEASPIDMIRFIIGDTDPDNPLFTDEELWYMYNHYGDNENMLMYQVYMAAATRYAKDGIKRSLGPQSEDPTARLNYFKDRAKYYEGLVAISGLRVTPANGYAYPKIFRKGMFSNPPWPKPKTRSGGNYIV